jgi:hypothetical protein
MKKIVAAAIKLSSGAIITRPPPARHHTLLLDAGTKEESHRAEQGFLTSEGEFVNRQDAWCIVMISMPKMRVNPSQTEGTLYTEDLW